jgi:hypothetical protein
MNNLCEGPDNSEAADMVIESSNFLKEKNILLKYVT